MIPAYVGASLFLCGALVLMVQRLTDAGYGSALADGRRDGATSAGSGSSSPRSSLDPSLSTSSTNGGSEDAAPMAHTGAQVVSAPPFTPTPSAVLLLLVVATALAAAVGILERWWRVAPGYVVVLLLALPLMAALTVIDVRVHRLPNRLTAAMATLTIVGLLFASLVAAQDDSLSMPSRAGLLDASGEPWGAMRRAVIGAVVLGLGYLLLALLGGGQGMGLGDVKLAPSLGALLAWPGWSVWCLGAMGAFILGGLWGMGLMVRGRGRSARMPFGPFMMAAALLAVIVV